MSIWSDIQDRSSGEQVRKEDQEEWFKKKLDNEAKKYIEGYADLLFQHGCTVDEIKSFYKIALDTFDDYIIVDELDEESQDLYCEKKDEWKLSSFLEEAVRHYEDEVFLSLKDSDERVNSQRNGCREPIDYSKLRVVLKHQVEKLIRKDSTKPSALTIVHDLYDRTYELFKYVYNEINNDTELIKLLEEKSVDGSIERLVVLISKHEGTFIPAPHRYVDSWWGDFNGTINYLVWDYNQDIELDKKIEEERLRRLSLPRKCKAVITKIGVAQKIGGFYTKDNKLIKLDETHQQSLRWHEHIFELKDMRFKETLPGKGWYAVVLTKKGETGEKVLLDAISQVEKKYGGFDGYTCDDWTIKLGPYVTDKNKKMASEITDILEQYNLKMAGALDE